MRAFIRHGAVLLMPLALSAFCASAQAPIDLRVALVIGNSRYARAPLPNPANDAQAMARSLKSLGFDVVELRDGSKAQMAEAIAKVRDVLKDKKGVGMLYYAGHGLQLDWRNYMVPVDAALAKASDVPEQAVDVGNVIEAFKSAGNRMNILVLDACRDNPFAGTASGKGLAQIDAPPGTFLAYATAPGNVADDGDGQNGLYTQYLLAELGKPTARIEDVFKRVRLQVRQKSQGRQIPWESTSLEDDFYFNDKASIAAKAERDRLASSTAARERAFANEKAQWDRIKDSKSADDLFAFLQRFPSGQIAEFAQSRLDQLQAAKVVATPDQSGLLNSAAAHYIRAGDHFEFVLKDGLTGVVSGRTGVTVRSLGGDLVEGVGSGMPNVKATTAGFILQDGNGSYDPPWGTIPSEGFQIGKRWSARTIQTRSNGQRQWVDMEAKVVARERITVPLGQFDTFKAEVTMEFQYGGRAKLTFWYEPGWSYALKMVRETRTATGAPDILVREMTARVRGTGS